MTQATVRYIQNGFMVNWPGGGGITVPPSLYAASVPEAVYWLNRIFDPISPPAAKAGGQAPAPSIIDNDDPLIGTEAMVSDVASGGFIVRQQTANLSGRPVEVYCVDMDAVHGQLNLIFAPPAAESTAAEFTFVTTIETDNKGGTIHVTGGPATHSDTYRISGTTDVAAGHFDVNVPVGMTSDELGTAIAQGASGLPNCTGKFSTQADDVTITPTPPVLLLALTAQQKAS